MLAAPLTVVGLLLAGCSAEVVPRSRDADCEKIAELAATGDPVDRLDPAVPAGPLPVPEGVGSVAATVVPSGDPPAVSPEETTIGAPDPDVDTLVAVAPAENDLDELAERVAAALEAQGMAPGGGHRAESSGRVTSFTWTYQSAARSGSVRSHDCETGDWLVFRDAIVPPVPDSASEPLPSCSGMARALPDGIYDDPAYQPDASNQSDDAEGSRRRCLIWQAGSASNTTRTVIRMERWAPAPDSWRNRYQQLTRGAAGFAGEACAIGTEAAPLDDGPDHSLHCVRETGMGVDITIAVAVDNDYWVGVRHDVRGGAASGERALASAVAILEAVQP